jgi:sugar PTS system EIIA component
MFKKLFGKKEKKTEETIFSPLSGKVVTIEEVPDPTFGQKMMGDGIAVEPKDGQVVSPVNGEIIQVFPTKHALGIRSETGLEILIHIGLETVNMKGEGFTAFVKEGDKVKVGQKLIDFDLELVKEKAASTITPIVLTNGDILENIEKSYNDNGIKGETAVLEVKVKA